MHIYLLKDLYQLQKLQPQVLMQIMKIKRKIKKCAAFTDCISEKNNPQVGNAKDTDVVMPIYNLIEYNDNY